MLNVGVTLLNQHSQNHPPPKILYKTLIVLHCSLANQQQLRNQRDRQV